MMNNTGLSPFKMCKQIGRKTMQSVVTIPWHKGCRFEPHRHLGHGLPSGKAYNLYVTPLRSQIAQVTLNV